MTQSTMQLDSRYFETTLKRRIYLMMAVFRATVEEQTTPDKVKMLIESEATVAELTKLVAGKDILSTILALDYMADAAFSYHIEKLPPPIKKEMMASIDEGFKNALNMLVVNQTRSMRAVKPSATREAPRGAPRRVPPPRQPVQPAQAPPMSADPPTNEQAEPLAPSPAPNAVPLGMINPQPPWGPTMPPNGLAPSKTPPASIPGQVKSVEPIKSPEPEVAAEPEKPAEPEKKAKPEPEPDTVDIQLL
jgi:hypothetical protein